MIQGRSPRRVQGRAVSAFVALVLSLCATPMVAAASLPGLRAIQASIIPADHAVRAVVMLDAVADESQLEALRSLGLTVQGLRHLPMALVRGTVAELESVLVTGLGKDVYLDRALHWHSKESTGAMRADLTRDLGYDGTGIGVAVVDSGIDASHPDLAGRVVRNVRVYSAEYLDVTGITPPGGWPHQPSLVIPFDDLPYNNTDTIGHGTHVAGIVAGEGAGDGELVGVAPGAHLVGYSTGEILFIFTALAAFDDILATHEEHNVRIINNSWGSSYQLFDPNAPINVATRILHDEGMTIVFSAGNDAEEMTANVNSMAPWVINSGSATVSKERSDFSSSGLMYDNTQVLELDADNHVRFEGDGLGLSHPDTSAPGSNIVSTCTPTGAIVCGATPPGGAASASGTSMSAPHMAGLAAIMLQARPEMTPKQVRQAMQASVVPMRDGAEFWRSGFGFVDAAAAIELVTSSDFSAEKLDALEAAQEAEQKAKRAYSVLASDHWKFDQLPATVLGLDSREFSFELAEGVDAIRAGIAFPADASLVGINAVFEWALSLEDPYGNQVATSTVSSAVGVSLLHADFAELGVEPKAGAWKLVATGEVNSTQPALLYASPLTVSVTQLLGQQAAAPTEPGFVADGSLVLNFTGGAGQTDSPEGCNYDVTGVSAQMVTGAPDAQCQAGTVGYAVNYGASLPAEFVSEPLAADLSIGGIAELRYYLADASGDAAAGGGLIADVDYALDAIDDSGNVLTAIAGGSIVDGGQASADPVFSAYPLEIPAASVPAGARLRLRLTYSGVYSSSMRLIWAGDYSDAGLTLQTAGGSGDSKLGDTRSAVGGALPVQLIWALGLLAAVRRSRRWLR